MSRTGKGAQVNTREGVEPARRRQIQDAATRVFARKGDLEPALHMVDTVILGGMALHAGRGATGP